MKILVTGGAGFIGSHIVDAYLEYGHEVIIIDDLSSGRTENINPKAKFYLMDIRSAELEKVFEIERPDIVNNHAAQKSIPKSVKEPMLDADINVKGFLNLLECSVKYGVKKFIAISSGGALAGDAEIIPTNEEYEPDMVSPYAITKYIGEKYLRYYSKIYNLKYSVLRYANVYGPRQNAEGECGAIPIFLENIKNGRPSNLYTYSDMPRGTSRDYIYVADVVKANIKALQKGDNQVINIGSGNEYYMTDIYNIMQEITGSDLPLIKENERVGDVKRSVLDVTKAKGILGWEPTVKLDEGISITYKNYGL